MSESVKIGGIGKNPAIDKINRLNVMDIKNQAVNRMEQMLLGGNFSESKKYTRSVPIDFDRVDWKGKQHGDKQRRVRMERDNLSEGKIMSGTSGTFGDGTERNDSEKISVHHETTGNIRRLEREQDIHLQYFGEAITGRTGLSSNAGDTKAD